jgi:hypothetical protein
MFRQPNNQINLPLVYTEYFASDNEPGGIENATNNTKVNVAILIVFFFK